jgi:hypothetical protein
MHYEDKEAIKAGKLTVVVYISQNYDGFDRADNCNYQIMSIQSCEYISPRFITQLYKRQNEIFGEILKDEEVEQYYLINITNMKRSKTLEFKASKPKNVSNTRNKLHRLH